MRKKKERTKMKDSKINELQPQAHTRLPSDEIEAWPNKHGRASKHGRESMAEKAFPSKHAEQAFASKHWPKVLSEQSIGQASIASADRKKGSKSNKTSHFRGGVQKTSKAFGQTIRG
jgi:hypothetical protein